MRPDTRYTVVITPGVVCIVTNQVTNQESSSMLIVTKRERQPNGWVRPAIGRCGCGAAVTLSGFTNSCERCGADYSMSGQKLAPRSQWGEETGETLADLMNIR